MREKAIEENSYLVLDFGSTFLKAGLFLKGNSLPHLFQVDYHGAFDVRLHPFGAEISSFISHLFAQKIDSKLQSYLFAWKSLFLQIQATFPFEFSQIQSILIATCSPSLVALNREGKIVGKALFPSDLPKEARKKEGYYQTLALQLLDSLQKENPDSISSIENFLSLGDYFTYLLCGKKITSLPTFSLASYLWGEPTNASLKALHPTLLEFSFPSLVESGAFLGYSDFIFSSFLKLSPKVEVYAGAFDYALDLLGANGFDSHQLILRGGTFPRINMPLPDFSSLNEGKKTNKIDEKRFREKALEKGWILMPHPFALGFNLSRLWEEPNSQGNSFEGLLAALTQLKEMGLSVQKILYCGGDSCDSVKNQSIADSAQLPLFLLEIADAVLLGGYHLLTWQREKKAHQTEDSLHEWIKKSIRYSICYKPQPFHR